jgi:septal ring factor EnvC (AmiA/AmiB activator)
MVEPEAERAMTMSNDDVTQAKLEGMISICHARHSSIDHQLERIEAGIRDLEQRMRQLERYGAMAVGAMFVFQILMQFAVKFIHA